MKRVTRQRVRFHNEFEINFTLKVGEPGITELEAGQYVKECMRYATAAFVWETRHPINGESQPYETRKKRSKYEGVESIKANPLDDPFDP